MPSTFAAAAAHRTGSPDDGIFELPFDPVRGVAAGPERKLFRMAFTDWLGVPGFDVGPDGRFLLVLAAEQESFRADPNVVLHVDDELRRRAPPRAGSATPLTRLASPPTIPTCLARHHGPAARLGRWQLQCPR